MQLSTHILGRPLDLPESLLFFDLMAKLDRPLWLHPARSNEGNGVPFFPFFSPGYEKRRAFNIFKSRLPMQIKLSRDDDFGKGIRTPGAAENDLFNPGGNGFH
jgi:hypothetical protein